MHFSVSKRVFAAPVLIACLVCSNPYTALPSLLISLNSSSTINCSSRARLVFKAFVSSVLRMISLNAVSETSEQVARVIFCLSSGEDIFLMRSSL